MSAVQFREERPSPSAESENRMRALRELCGLPLLAPTETDNEHERRVRFRQALAALENPS